MCAPPRPSSQIRFSSCFPWRPPPLLVSLSLVVCRSRQVVSVHKISKDSSRLGRRFMLIRFALFVLLSVDVIVSHHTLMFVVFLLF